MFNARLWLEIYFTSHLIYNFIIPLLVLSIARRASPYHQPPGPTQIRALLSWVNWAEQTLSGHDSPRLWALCKQKSFRTKKIHIFVLDQNRREGKYLDDEKKRKVNPLWKPSHPALWSSRFIGFEGLVWLQIIL